MGKGSAIPFNEDEAVKLWCQVMNARERCGLPTPAKSDPMKGWQNSDFESAVPQEERYSWFLAFLYLQLRITEDWKEAHKGYISKELGGLLPPATPTP